MNSGDSDISESKLAMLNLFKEDIWKRKKELNNVRMQ